MSTTVATPARMASSHTHSLSHSHSHSHSRSRPTNTPRACSTAQSVGQPMPPRLSAEGRTPQAPPSKRNDAHSPGYFGFVVGGNDSIPPDSNPGNHAKQNWDFPSSQARSAAEKAQQKIVESNPDYAEFRRQSEHQARFQLKGHTLSSMTRPSQSRQSSKSSVQQKRPSTETPLSPGNRGGFFDSMQIDEEGQAPNQDQQSFFDIPRADSPGPMSPQLANVADHQHARLSLPSNRLQSPPIQERKPQRAETLPLNTTQGQPTMITAQQLSELLTRMSEKVLVLDLRVYPQYSSSRVRGALNLCIPTTLLKRPSFTVQKLLDTFNNDHDRDEFEKWEDCPYIVVYDANSMQLKEAISSQNVLKKFVTEGWKGHGLIVTGGFLQISKSMPSLVVKDSVESNGSGKQMLAINAVSHDSVAVAGGCSMPSGKGGPANAFFGNIRQNMDLLDGVGQLPVKRPQNMSERTNGNLPAWLKRAASISNEGKLVSDKFLAIEKAEQRRMQEALSGHVSYGSPLAERPKRIQIAGIEKGSKNRYNNIFPYDHTRVRLQGVPEGDCDYINANSIRTSYSNRRYIATQAPVPGTFNDFWRLTWEQDIRVIVMLTAEQEGGQVKSHPYWVPSSYGPLKLKQLSEKRVSLEPRSSSFSSSSSISSSTRPSVDQSHRPSIGQRRSTQPDPSSKKSTPEITEPSASDPPAVIVRHFTLSHSAFPFQPMREITQLQYTQWPDFGAPAVPTAILGLVEQVNKHVHSGSHDKSSSHATVPGERPIIVHCSAGCGRTGTFCTIDSVIDMLKHQRDVQQKGDDDMDVDEQDDWVHRDDIDLVAMAVEEMRKQRLSMVQNLRQFVLCYESVLEWVVEQQQNGQRVGERDEKKSSEEKRPGMGGRSKTGTHAEKEKARPGLHGRESRKSYYG